MLADPKMTALYHLAEQLQLQDEDKNLLADELLVFKYWHRNFVGYNDTSRDLLVMTPHRYRSSQTGRERAEALTTLDVTVDVWLRVFRA